MSAPVSLAAILDWGNLCLAWEKVADNRGAAGPDRVSIRRFARNWEENLRRLVVLVQGRRYRPGRLRNVPIPKSGGGVRVLRIPNVGDRVLQRAALNVLEDHYERKFLNCSYGYRPRRSLHDAVASILQHRSNGYRWVLDADIDACFDSFDHELLRSYLGRDIDDPQVLDLIDLWIENGRVYRGPDRGISQGMPISPLLCNVYLHRLDWQLVRGRWGLVRYADDFIVCCRSEDEAVRVKMLIGEMLSAMRLRYEPRKTQIASFDDGFSFLGVYFDADGYSFTWEDKRFRIEGDTPWWLWPYVPHDYC